MSEQNTIAGTNKKMKRTSYLLKKKYTERWTYFFYFIFLGLVLMALYMNRKMKAEENLMAHHALSTISSDIRKAAHLVVIPIATPLKKKEKLNVSLPEVPSRVSFSKSAVNSNRLTDNEKRILNSFSSTSLKKSNIRLTDNMSTGMLDTQAYKTSKIRSARRNPIQQTEIRIPCFADKEGLKMYQNKLLQSGIRLDLTGIVYGTKDNNGMQINDNTITYCVAYIYIGDFLYKSVVLDGFKEFRIKWDTYRSGEVNIKSISMLDNNNTVRKF